MSFGIFLIKKGNASDRNKVLEDYAVDVFDWNNGGREAFSSLSFSYLSNNSTYWPLQQEEAELFAEFDVLFALGQLTVDEITALRRE